MKKRTFAITGLIVIAVLVMAACSPQPEQPAEVPQPAVEEAMEEPMPAEEEPAQEAEPMQEEEPAAEEPAQEEPMAAEQPAAEAEVDVEALIIEKVAGKHDVERIFNADKTREEWEETLDRMIGYGAKINEEEKQIIIDYLLSR